MTILVKFLGRAVLQRAAGKELWAPTVFWYVVPLMGLLLCLGLLLPGGAAAQSTSTAPATAVSSQAAPAPAPAPAAVSASTAAPSSMQEPVIRGVHMTGWAAGSARQRRLMAQHLKAAGLNAVVIALKEFDGKVFVKGVPQTVALGSYVNAIPDLAEAVRDFRSQGIYTVGRIVLFKDDILARKRPDLAVRRPDGKIWTNYNGVAWVDPYQKEVWEYDLAIASRAAAAGFDELQFDYIRFPSDVNISLCRYSRPDHTKATAAQDIVDFLAEAEKRLRPLGVTLSIAVFGLTTTDDTGMGIGQHIARMTQHVDYVSPMMYPSHYHKGEYGIPNPNKDPYRTIHMGLRDARERLGPNFARLRPYLQDFSMGFHYGPAQLRAQIFAAARMGVTNWVLWNPGNRYTWSGMPTAQEIERAMTGTATPASEVKEKP